MTDETTDDNFKAGNDAYWAAHPDEWAEVQARSDAMVQTAAVYERVLADQLTAIRRLRETEDGMEMLTRIAGVVALEQLRGAALGCGVPTWQEALQRYDVLTGSTIESIKPIFRKEATSN